MKAAVLSLVMIGLIAGGAAYYATHLSANPSVRFRTATITRGDVLSTISATGTVEPEELVDVGAQVAGKISSIGPDPHKSDKPIDYGSVVKQGAILALIDDSVYKAQVDQAQAQLLRARPIASGRGQLEQAEQDGSGRGTPAGAGHRRNRLRPRGRRLPGGKGGRGSRQSHDQAKRSLHASGPNESRHTIIKSPVDGTIIDRRVNVGQTVVASLNAPSYS